MTTEPGTTMPATAPCGLLRTCLPGWAPYRFGHWGWVDPWGWTWVDDSSWGFAPFHYGRWAYQNARWEWSPGAVQARPVYAPALVVFVGGSGWAPSAGEGIGWFALGPREVYIPPYQVSADYERRINVSHVANFDAQTAERTHPDQIVYVNRTAPRGMTFVPREVFTQSRPAGGAVLTVTPAEVTRAPFMGMNAQIAPQRESIIARPVGASVPQPPAGDADPPRLFERSAGTGAGSLRPAAESPRCEPRATRRPAGNKAPPGGPEACTCTGNDGPAGSACEAGSPCAEDQSPGRCARGSAARRETETGSRGPAAAAGHTDPRKTAGDETCPGRQAETSRCPRCRSAARSKACPRCSATTDGHTRPCGETAGDKAGPGRQAESSCTSSCRPAARSQAEPCCPAAAVNSASPCRETAGDKAVSCHAARSRSFPSASSARCAAPGCQSRAQQPEARCKARWQQSERPAYQASAGQRPAAVRC